MTADLGLSRTGERVVTRLQNVMEKQQKGNILNYGIIIVYNTTHCLVDTVGLRYPARSCTGI